MIQEWRDYEQRHIQDETPAERAARIRREEVEAKAWRRLVRSGETNLTAPNVDGADVEDDEPAGPLPGQMPLWGDER